MGCQLLCVLAQLPVFRDSNGDDKGMYIHSSYMYVMLIGMEVSLF